MEIDSFTELKNTINKLCEEFSMELMEYDLSEYKFYHYPSKEEFKIHIYVDDHANYICLNISFETSKLISILSAKSISAFCERLSDIFKENDLY